MIVTIIMVIAGIVLHNLSKKYNWIENFLLAFVIVVLCINYKNNNMKENILLLLLVVNLVINIGNNSKIKRIMKEKFEEILGRIDTATNGIAAQIRAWKEKIKAGDMSADDEAALLAEFDTAATNLEAVGKDAAPAEGSGDGSGDQSQQG